MNTFFPTTTTNTQVYLYDNPQLYFPLFKEDDLNIQSTVSHGMARNINRLTIFFKFKLAPRFKIAHASPKHLMTPEILSLPLVLEFIVFILTATFLLLSPFVVMRVAVGLQFYVYCYETMLHLLSTVKPKPSKSTRNNEVVAQTRDNTRFNTPVAKKL